MLPITDITTFTFQDFPGYTACIVWFAGCNFRCPYCHNPEFVTGIANKDYKIIPEEEVFNFLQSRIGLLDGVVLSGGECTLSNIYEFTKKIKTMGYLLKIDTNGTNFELIERMVNEKILDFVAIDYKAPKYKFNLITGMDKFDIFEKTLNFLINSNINMEVRTTVHTDLLNEYDINNIILDLDSKGFKREYYIQNFRNDNKSILGNLTEQKKQLDINLIQKKSFKINYRNF